MNDSLDIFGDPTQSDSHPVMNTEPDLFDVVGTEYVEQFDIEMEIVQVNATPRKLTGWTIELGEIELTEEIISRGWI
jgi:hypothetical protein